MRIKSHFFSLLFAFASLCVKGQMNYVKIQPKNLNKLHAALANCKPDTNKIRILLDLADGLYQRNQDEKDIDSAIHYLKESQVLSATTNNLYYKNQVFCRLGEIMFLKRQPGEGNAYFLQAISMAHSAGNDLEEAIAWQKFANVSEYKPGIIYQKKAVTLFHKLKDTDREIDARLKLGMLYQRNAKNETAAKIIQDIIAQYEPAHPKQLAFAHFVLSGLNRYKGNLNISLFHILKSIDLDNLSKDSVNASRFYGELGQVYQAMGNTKKSIYWYRKTVAIREKLPGLQPMYITRTIGFIAQQLILENKADEALREVLSAEKRMPPKDDFDRAVYGQIKGDCYYALKRFELAEQSYLKMIPYLNHTAIQNEITQIMYYSLAKFYVDRNNYNKAPNYLNKLLANSYSKLFRMNIELLKFKQDSAARYYLSAIDHFKSYKAISDSIFDITKSKQIEELQIKYRTNEREKDIAALRKTESLQREKIASSEKVKTLTFSSIALLIILIGLLLNGYRLKQRTNHEIQLKNKSLSHLVDEKDNLLLEKQWLLKEIHHRVKNNLQIVMGLLQRQASYIDNAAALIAIQNSENRMRSIALIHQKLYQSENLDLINMPEYVDELIQHLKDSFDLGNRINFEKSVDEIYLDVSQAVPLGLILNEAITNSIKYAYPSQKTGIIHISLHKAPEKQNVLVIKDNGAGLANGFNLEKVDSMGMNLMRGLSKQLGGKFEISNNEGVTIRICFKTEAFVTTAGHMV